MFNFIYDVGSYANWVNDYILQGSFNEQLAIDPTEYCKEMGYDALALADEYEKLHVNLYSVDVDNPTKNKSFSTLMKLKKHSGLWVVLCITNSKVSTFNLNAPSIPNSSYYVIETNGDKGR